MKLSQKLEAMKARALLAPETMEPYVVDAHALGNIEKVAARNNCRAPQSPLDMLNMRAKMTLTFQKTLQGI